MPDSEDRTKLQKGLQAIKVIWLAMLGSLLIYVIIAHISGEALRKGLAGRFSDEFLVNLKGIFAVMSVAVLIATKYIRRSVFDTKQNVSSRSFSTESTPSSGAGKAVVKYATVMIVSLALCESIGIYGFVLYRLEGSFQTLYGFLAMSALGMFYYRPKEEELNEIYQGIKRDSI